MIVANLRISRTPLRPRMTGVNPGATGYVPDTADPMD